MASPFPPFLEEVIRDPLPVFLFFFRFLLLMVTLRPCLRYRPQFSLLSDSLGQKLLAIFPFPFLDSLPLSFFSPVLVLGIFYPYFFFFLLCLEVFFHRLFGFLIPTSCVLLVFFLLERNLLGASCVDGVHLVISFFFLLTFWVFCQGLPPSGRLFFPRCRRPAIVLELFFCIFSSCDPIRTSLWSGFSNLVLD